MSRLLSLVSCRSSFGLRFIIEVSLSEPHTSESNGDFSYIICRTSLPKTLCMPHSSVDGRTRCQSKFVNKDSRYSTVYTEEEGR